MTTATNTKFYYLFIQWGYIYDHKGGDKSLAAKVLYCLNATPHGHFGDSCWVQPNIALGGSCFSENFILKCYCELYTISWSDYVWK